MVKKLKLFGLLLAVMMLTTSALAKVPANQGKSKGEPQAGDEKGLVCPCCGWDVYKDGNMWKCINPVCSNSWSTELEDPECNSECWGEPGQCPDDGDLCTIEQCEAGKCVSKPVVCSGSMCCPDLGCFDYLNSNDPNNCGGCGVTCESGVCISGTCDYDSPPVLGMAIWDFGCAPNDIEVRVEITDDVGVVSATFNDEAMVLIEGDDKDGVWLYTVNGADKKLGDCIPATIEAFDTIGQPAGLNFQVCWLITGC